MPNETQGIRQWLTRLGEWAAHPCAYGLHGALVRL